MGRDDDVRERQQPRQNIVLQRQVGPILEEQLRLFFIHIQPQITQLPALEGVNQRGRVHQATATGIDQHCPRLHVRQGFAVDQMLALIVERAVQADDLRLGQQLRQTQVAGAERFDLRVGVRVVGQQLATETVHDFRERCADLPGADHADGFAHQVETGQPMQAEIAFAGTVVGAVQAAVECQDQRHGMFGHRMGRVGRNAHHRQPETFRGREVDMVVTGRAQGDQTCAARRQAFEHRRTEVIIDEGADHLMLIGQRRCINAQTRRLKVQLDAGGQVGGEETVAVVGLAAE
ncbi:hypothetical protein D3C87_1334280 [compost metagenome]